MMIILTATQATGVLGEASPGCFVEPRMLADGVTFALPESLIGAPGYESVADMLTGLPTRDVAASEWPQDPDV